MYEPEPEPYYYAAVYSSARTGTMRREWRGETRHRHLTVLILYTVGASSESALTVVGVPQSKHRAAVT